MSIQDKPVAFTDPAAGLVLSTLLPSSQVPAELPRPRAGRVVALFVSLGAGLLIAVLVAAALGQLQVPLVEVIGSICARMGLGCGVPPAHPNGDAALWEVRFPRVALAVLVGAALSAAGALMQGVFGNPLADPGVVGVSAGAALGASTVIVLGFGAGNAWAIPAGAFVTGMLTALLVYSISRSGGRSEVITLILTGIAVNAFAGAVLAFLTFAATTNQREQIVFWQMGTLSGALWPQVAVIVPLSVLGLLCAFMLAPQLDLLALGDDAARHLGVNIERLRIGTIAVVSILTAVAVAFAGIVGFVGLVVPHVIRMIMGPGNRVLVPASALGGALLLVVADTFARTAIPYAELPLGMLTALVGGPFFFYLLRSARSRTGGWV